MHLLPEEPSIQMLATNMKDGQLCSFTREGLLLKNGEEHSLIKNVNTSISLAVSASAAFPGMFPPALIEAELIGVHRGELPATGPPILTDGGVFDNLAIRRLTQVAEEIEHTGGDGRSLTHLIVSDAGGAFNDRWFTKMTGLVGTALRAADILMKRIHEMERERIDRRGEPELASPALVRLDIADICPVSASDGGMPEAAQMHMKYIRTDLDRFSRSEREALVSHGYAISHKMLTPIFTMSPDIAANIRIPICQQSPDKLVRSLQGSQNRKVRAVSYRDWILVPQILLCTVILWAGWILNPLVNRQTIHISGQQRLESTLLVEIMAQVLESASPDFEVHRDIDEPEDLFTNLLLNKTQLYPGYPGAVQDQLSAIRKEKSSGTGAKELGNVSQLNDLLRQDEPGGHLRALEPFGFESRFVFVMMRDHVWLGQTLGTGNSQPTLTKLVLSCVS